MIYTDEFLDAPWGKVCVVCAGPKTDKPVLFVHGRADSAGCFIPLVDRMPSGFRIMMLELPGCGKSTPLPAGQPLSVYDFVCVLKFVVDQYNLQQFSYVGHSMGAQIGLLYNILYPNQIDRFVSLDSLVYLPVEPKGFRYWFHEGYEKFYNPKNYATFTSTPEQGPLYTYAQALEKVMTSRDLTEDAGRAVLARTLLPTKFSSGKESLFRLCWEQRNKAIPVPTFSEKYQKELYGKMSIPHLIVFANQSANAYLQFVRPTVLEEHCRNNPNFRATVLEGNHDVHINSPSMVIKKVAPFLMGSLGDQTETRQVLKTFMYVYNKRSSNVRVTSKL